MHLAQVVGACGGDIYCCMAAPVALPPPAQRPVVSFNWSSARQWSRLQYDRLGGNLFWNEQAHFIEGVGHAGGVPQVIEYDRRTRFMDIAVDPLHG